MSLSKATAREDADDEALGYILRQAKAVEWWSQTLPRSEEGGPNSDCRGDHVYTEESCRALTDILEGEDNNVD